MWLHNHVTQHGIQLLKSNIHGLCYPQPHTSWRTQGEIGRVIIIVRKHFSFLQCFLKCQTYPLCRNPTLPQSPLTPTNHHAWGILQICSLTAPLQFQSWKLKLLMLLRSDITLQLEAALADPLLPCPCLAPETSLKGNLVFNMWLPLSQGSQKLHRELTNLTEFFN